MDTLLKNLLSRNKGLYFGNFHFITRTYNSLFTLFLGVIFLSFIIFFLTSNVLAGYEVGHEQAQTLQSIEFSTNFKQHATPSVKDNIDILYTNFLEDDSCGLKRIASEGGRNNNIENNSQGENKEINNPEKENKKLVSGTLFTALFIEPVSSKEIIQFTKSLKVARNSKIVIWVDQSSNTKRLHLFVSGPLPLKGGSNKRVRDKIIESLPVSKGEVSLNSLAFPKKVFTDSTYYFDNSNTIIVPEEYNSIQRAIKEAIPGSMVKIKPGTYKENLTVNKSLFFKGAGRDSVEIWGTEVEGPLVSLQLTSEGIGVDRTIIVLEGEVPVYDRQKRKLLIEKAIQEIRARVEEYDIKRHIVAFMGSKRIFISVPSDKIDVNTARRLVGRIGHLELQTISKIGDPGSSLAPKNASQEVIYGRELQGGQRKPYLVKKEPLLSGDIVKSFEIQKTQKGSNKVKINLTLKSDAEKKLASIVESLSTGKDQIAISVDNLVQDRFLITTNLISKAKETGSINTLTIKGRFSSEEAKLLAIAVKYQVPVELNEITNLNSKMMIISNKTPNLIIEGLTIKPTDLTRKKIGIYNKHPYSTLIRHCTVQNSSLGLNIEGASNVSMLSSSLSRNEIGAKVSKASKFSLEKSKVLSNTYGIKNYGALKSYSSKIFENETGLFLKGEADATLEGNYLEENETAVDIYNPYKFNGIIEGSYNWFFNNDINFSGVNNDKQKELKAEDEPLIDDLEIVRRNNNALLTWTNPKSTLVENVTVRKKQNSYPQVHTSGEKVECQNEKLKGELGGCIDSGLMEGKTYYYSIFSQTIHGLWDDKLVENKNGAKIYIKKIVTFKDRNLENAIREKINKTEGEIYASELKELKKLTADESGIQNLKGLENCVNLLELNLPRNNISGIEPLSNLDNLEKLDLRGNKIKEIDPLSNLAELDYLNLNANLLSDISPLLENSGFDEDSTISLYWNYLDLSEGSKDKRDLEKLKKSGAEVHFDHQRSPIKIPDPNLERVIKNSLGDTQGNIYDKDLKKITYLHASESGIKNLEGLRYCRNLKELDLHDNEIENIFALSELESLNKLDLSQNKVTDLSPLVYNEGLDEGDILDLRDNNLNLIKPSKHLRNIQKIENRGVKVSYKPQKTTPFFEQENYHRFVLQLEGAEDLSTESGDEKVEKTKEILRARGDQYGTSNLSFTPSSKGKLVVNLSTNYEDERVQELFALQGLMVFKKVIESSRSREKLKPSNSYQEILPGKNLVNGKVVFYLVQETPLMVASKYVKEVKVRTSQRAANPTFISFEFDGEGSEKFANLIKNLEPNEDRVAIVVDGVVQSAPVISQSIWDHANEDNSVRSAIIEGDFSIEGAKRLAIVLRNGPLPVKIDIISSTMYGIDDLLKNALIEEIGKSGKDITRTDLRDVTQLNATKKEISSLLGLEFCKNLEDLSLANNSIEDISPLSSLESLEKLDLRGNEITDIIPLVNNKGLREGDMVLLNQNYLKLSKDSGDTKNIVSLRERGVEIPAISTHIVAKGADTYSSIQEAIDEAEPGDTVLVKEGIYKENISIDKNLILKGEGAEKVKIISNKKNHPVLLVGPSDIETTVKEVTLSGVKGVECDDEEKGICPSGVSISGKSMATITGSSISGNEVGIGFYHSSNGTITDTNITGNNYGIGVLGSSRAKLQDNKITGSKLGIYSTSSRTKIEGSNNEMMDNGIDLVGNCPSGLRRPLVDSTKDKIVFPNKNYTTLQHAVDALLPGGTVFLEEGSYQGGITVGKRITMKAKSTGRAVLEGNSAAISLVEQANLRLDNLKISGEQGGLVLGSNAKLSITNSVITENDFGISLYNSSQANIKNSAVSRNKVDGLYLYDSSRVSIEDVNISENRETGINLHESSSATVKQSNISSNGSGAGLSSSSQMTIIDTVISDNENDGIDLYHSSEALLKNLKLIGNGTGLELVSSSQAKIVGSTISENEHQGILLRESSNVTIEDNIIHKNGVGIEISDPNRFQGTLTGFGNQVNNNNTNFKGIKTGYIKELTWPRGLLFKGLEVLESTEKVSLAWTNPPKLSFNKEVIRRQKKTCPKSHKEGQKVGCNLTVQPGENNQCSDHNVIAGTTYCYSIFTQNSDGSWNDRSKEGINSIKVDVMGVPLTRSNVKTLFTFEKDKHWLYSLVLKTKEETVKGSISSSFIGERDLNGETVSTQKLVTRLQGEEETTFNFYAKRDTGLYIVGTKGTTDIEPLILKDPYVVLEYPVGLGYGWKTPISLPIPDEDIVITVDERITSIDSQVTVPAGNFTDCVKTMFHGSTTLDTYGTPLFETSGEGKKELLVKVEGKNWIAPGAGSVQSYIKVSSYDKDTDRLQSSFTMIEKLEKIG